MTIKAKSKDEEILVGRLTGFRMPGAVFLLVGQQRLQHCRIESRPVPVAELEHRLAAVERAVEVSIVLVPAGVIPGERMLQEPLAGQQGLPGAMPPPKRQR